MNLKKTYRGSIYGDIGEYRKPTFSQVWESADDFLSDYTSVGIPTTIKEDSARTLFYLLYANYSSRMIAPDDETLFKYKIFSTIFQYAPTWEKKLEIQQTIRNLSEEEILSGSVQIYNSAGNPSTEPSNGSSDILGYIDHQNVTRNKIGKLNAYSYLWEALRADVTSQLIEKFNNFFIKIGERYVKLDYSTGD